MAKHEAFVSEGFKTNGLGMVTVVIARARSGDELDVGFFMNDMFCLGVKDAFLIERIMRHELEASLKKLFNGEKYEAISPACARKLVEGAEAYAQRFGISPHRDYRKARRVLGGIDAADSTEEFTFGHQGKPHYMEGPNDSAERTAKVLALLTQHCGEGNFFYTLASEIPDDDIPSGESLAALEKLLPPGMTLDDLKTKMAEVEKLSYEARDALVQRLRHWRDNGVGFYKFTGAMTAAHLRSPQCEINYWLGAFKQQESDPEPTGAELDALRTWITNYWNYVGAGIKTVADDTHFHLPDIGEDEGPFDGEMEKHPDNDFYSIALVEWLGGFVTGIKRYRPDLTENKDVADDWQFLLHVTGHQIENWKDVVEKAKTHAGKDGGNPILSCINRFVRTVIGKA